MSRQGKANYTKPTHYKGEHLNWSDLIDRAQGTYLHETYLSKIKSPPNPQEFHVSHLKHETHKFSILGIKEDEGFKDPKKGLDDPDRLPLVWFSLAVKHKPTEEEHLQQENVRMACESSPAFSEKSRYGSYRFTFLVKEVLEEYKKQFCGGKPPVMRILRTSLYRQEVMYAVLVHSPKDNGFTEYPELSDGPNAICTYKDGCFIWRSQTMFETNIKTPKENLKLKKMNWLPSVWDHVTIALHVDGKPLKFGSVFLRERLTFCEKDKVIVAPRCYDTCDNAQRLVRKLWDNVEQQEEDFQDLSDR